MLGQRKLQVKDKDYVQTMNVIGQNVNWFKGKEITFLGFIYKDKDVTGNKAVVLIWYNLLYCGCISLGMIVTGKNIEKFQKKHG